MNKKSNFIDSSGKNIRVVGHEVTQTFYALTKDPNDKSKEVKLSDFRSHYDDEYGITPTFSDLVKLFKTGMTKDGKVIPPLYHVNDIVMISPSDGIKNIEKPIKTTVGRYIFNKIMIESTGLDKLVAFQNECLTDKKFGSLEGVISNMLKNDIIGVETMRKFVEYRDWLGLQLHAVITTSFTPGVSKVPPKTKALKKKLLAEHAKEIKEGNVRVIEDIENQLIKSMLDEIGDDPGLDLYVSGARGSINNHLKNIFLSRGAIKNPTTKEYEIITNSLMDGLEKKDICIHSNMIISGAYPKSCATAVTGYMAKELLAAFQSEVLGPKDSDCGTLRTKKIKLTESNYSNYLFRYVKSGTKIVMLTEDNKSSFVGKEVDMRTPLYCIGYGKTKCICNKCAGDYNYILEKPNIGLTTTKCGTSLTNLNMKKFHENIATTQKIDIEDMVI